MAEEKVKFSMARTDKVLLIYTGGTIGMGRNERTGTLEPLDMNHLLSNIPELRQVPVCIDVHQFESPIDSSDVSPRTWAQLVGIIASRYDDYDGFVVLHGTDTMAYTASALSFMLENLTKPVILTGSQLPIGQLRTDGKENLVTSIEIASLHNDDGTSVVPEVCIYFSGRLLRGNRSTKQNADGFDAFASFNYPDLCRAGVNFAFRDHSILRPDFGKPMCPHYEMNSSVVVFSLFPGIEENIVRHVLAAPEIKGMVIRSYGSGNAPKQAWLTRLLREATDRGVTIVNVSQCIAGTVEMHRYGTGYQLLNSGVLSGYDSTVEAAVTKLMYLFGRYSSADDIRRLMNTNICGEITL